MSNILYVIDGYLSSEDKVEVTKDLIYQLRKLDPDRKIMLVNKFGNSWGLENHVDYYREYLDGFMVGHPPQDLIDSKIFDKPYVYFDTSAGTLENWMPYVGVSDHVANVYNGFIYASKEANSLGFSKVFRVEYDMLFDEIEFNEIKTDLKRLEDEDFLIYGKRQEGKWAKTHQSLIDVHFCGYSTRMIDKFDFVKNDEEYWSLCKKIEYAGKWAEYVMSMVFRYNTKEDKTGIIYEGQVREKFKKSKFDRLSSSGEWTDKWKDIPKICKLDVGGGHQPDKTKIVIFYYNSDYDTCEVEVVGNKNYYNKIILNKNCWTYQIIDRQDNMVFMSKVTHSNGVNVYVKKVNNENYDKLTNRFIKK